MKNNFCTNRNEVIYKLRGFKDFENEKALVDFAKNLSVDWCFGKSRHNNTSTHFAHYDFDKIYKFLTTDEFHKFIKILEVEAQNDEKAEKNIGV